MNKQAGFTLIELAIVLVIIGLLLGGVLRGQELINSAKVKNMATDFRNKPTLIYQYQDKFRALPGDDKSAKEHVGTTATNGDGNGVISGAYNAISGESFQFWQQIRLANLDVGSTDTSAGSYIPTNAEGGKVGIQSGSTKSIAGLSGSYVICSEGILGKFAKQLDTTMDDGNTASGAMMATAAAVDGITSAAAATSSGTTITIDDTLKYTVCMAF